MMTYQRSSHLKIGLLAPAALALAALACSLPPVGPGGAATPSVPAPTVEVPTSEPTTPAVTPEEVCAPAREGTIQVIHRQAGFCFLAPDSYTFNPPDTFDSMAIGLTGPELIPSPTEPLYAGLRGDVIAVPGAAGGVTALEWANEELAALALAGTGSVEETTAGGQPAAIIPDYPAFYTMRRLVVAANDTLYVFDQVPNAAPTDSPEAAVVGQTWDLLIETLAFFPAEYSGPVLLPEDVCPTATAGTTLYVNRRDGYCLLLPEGFSENPEFPGQFMGGPEISGLPEPLTPHASLTAGYFGPPGPITLDELVENFLINSPDRTLVNIADATIGGQPSKVVYDKNEPLADRTAYVLVNGQRMYTLLAQPDDPAEWPDAAEPLETLWTTVTGSIQFFEPWR